MLKLKIFQFNMFGVNSYLLWNSETLEAAIIDPGMANSAERTRLDSFIEAEGLKLTQAINTHLHVDHIFGAAWVKEKHGASLAASEADAFLGERAAMQCRMFGLPSDMAAVAIDRPLTDGEKIDVCGYEATVITTPGHSPGGIVIYFPAQKIAFTGDTIFNGSYGRTDLPGGNYDTLMRSIREKVLTLPADVRLYPGHGDATTVGRERQNPMFA